MDKTFNKCVDSLEWLAKKLHVTYEQLNVMIFVIDYPALLAVLGIL
jgi:hypothetical protein